MRATANRFLLLAILVLCCAVRVSHAQTTILSPADAERLAREEQQVRLIALLALLPVVVAFSFVIFVLYRRKREAFFREQETMLKLNMAEVELKALKAQINPHFIFNCMNSIHHYMHSNDIKTASDYLIKFSQLIRLVLENSSMKSLTLTEELKMLDFYVQLEQLRLGHKFSYRLNIAKDINADEIEIPGFLLQPFVENAIWHELTRLQSEAELVIDIRQDPSSDGLLCEIISQGRGQLPTSERSPLVDGIKKTSLGMKLVRERMDLLNRTMSVHADFSGGDISDPSANYFGYKVTVQVPILQD